MGEDTKTDEADGVTEGAEKVEGKSRLCSAVGLVGGESGRATLEGEGGAGTAMDAVEVAESKRGEEGSDEGGE